MQNTCFPVCTFSSVHILPLMRISWTLPCRIISSDLFVLFYNFLVLFYLMILQLNNNFYELITQLACKTHLDRHDIPEGNLCHCGFLTYVCGVRIWNQEK